MNQVPTLFIFLGDEKKGAPKRLELLLFDLREAQKLGQRHQRLRADHELRLRVLVRIVGLLGQDLLDDLVKLFKDV